ncbi:hypothetical protein [Actinomadura harenae]|uniref:Type IV secretion system protein n=1 Tax=Actinomadura harenae TaxID=2483351 RepID=A0A3M2M2T1_9ACTN|nr:hypothetical protein [Actinomadura harenae]RMI43927.1 hypothetical protein EBO15_14590 [Actinomadura harenae]
MTPFAPPCSTVLDPQCVQAVDHHDGHAFGIPLPDIAAEAGGNALDGLAKAITSAVKWFVSQTASWWVQSPSPNLEAEPAVARMHELMQPLTITVALGALLVVAAKLTLLRRATPLIDAGTGLAVLAVVSVLGVVVPNRLLEWGDQWVSWALDASASGGFANKMTNLLLTGQGVPSVLVVVLGIVALFIGIVQALLLILRGAAIVLLAGLLPLAAAGMMTGATKAWFGKVGGWMLALIFYKPAAAAVYATAFTFVGNGRNLHTVLAGFAMMLLSLIAFPVLLRFFTWTTGNVSSGSGGGIMNSVMGGLTAIGALRGYGWSPGMAGAGSGHGSAGEHANRLSEQLGDQHGSGLAASSGLSGSSATGASGGGSDGGPSGQPAAPSAMPGRSGTAEGATPSGSTAQTSDAAAGSMASGGEPVGPATVRMADRERRRGPEMIRWLGNPTGSGGDGGTSSAPTGAEDAGGGASGA